MDLVAEMLHSELRQRYSDTIQIDQIDYSITKYLRMLPFIGSGSKAFAADRLIHRYWDYPERVRKLEAMFDVFHIVDHSYSALAHALPPERTIITCHDTDAFQSICNPELNRRSLAFRLMTKRLIAGFRKAAKVICVSRATQRQLIETGVMDTSRTVVIPNGVDPSFSPEPDRVADLEAERLLGPPDGAIMDLINVGSTIPRKRIDILLRIMADVSKLMPNIRLIRVGGGLRPEQYELARVLGVDKRIISLPFVNRRTLAAIYRRAVVAIQPSEAEGFGLPVVEALACGSNVVATDLPAYREVGASAVTYCPLSDIRCWSSVIVNLLAEAPGFGQMRNPRSDNVQQASCFSWRQSAYQTASLYKQVQLLSQGTQAEQTNHGQY